MIENSLSIIIPCFNEELRLPKTLETIVDYFDKHPRKIEFILVDDGSSDATLSVIESFQRNVFSPKGLENKYIRFKQNRGKGAAVRAGLEAAHNDLCLLSDADLSVPIEEFERLIAYVPEFDLIIGSRRIAESNVQISQSSFRRFLGDVFAWLSRIVLGVPVSDFTCGFKLIKSERARQLVSALTIDRWAYDSELLVIAWRRKWKIREIGVTWLNDERSKVHLGTDVIRSFLELVGIRIKDLMGSYV